MLTRRFGKLLLRWLHPFLCLSLYSRLYTTFMLTYPDHPQGFVQSPRLGRVSEVSQRRCVSPPSSVWHALTSTLSHQFIDGFRSQGFHRHVGNPGCAQVKISFLRVLHEVGRGSVRIRNRSCGDRGKDCPTKPQLVLTLR